LIVWTEPDGADYALSFQDADGCGEVWNFILEVQHHLTLVGTYNLSCMLYYFSPFVVLVNSVPSGENRVGSSSPRLDIQLSKTVATIRSGHLPEPELGIIPDIERAIKALVRGQIREKICECIQREVRH
jgi:protein phosphatase-4 regulatory subunit 3